MKRTAAFMMIAVMAFTLFVGRGNTETEKPAQDETIKAEREQTDTKLTADEQSVLEDYFADEVFADVTAEAMTPERVEKFPAVTKVYSSEAGNFFVCAGAVGYHGPVNIAIAIDGSDLTIKGLQIVDDIEADEYVRDWENDWFVGRFNGKDVHQNLVSVYLEAKAENEIVTVTGATISTDAVILGVNAAFSVIREYALGETADAVAYKAELNRRTPEEN